MVALFTAQKRSCVETMTWEMVDLQQGRFLRRVSVNKGLHDAEWMPLPRALRSYLRVFRAGLPVPPQSADLIVGRWHAARRALRGACAVVGFAPVCPDHLISTFGSWWDEAGGSPDGLDRYRGKKRDRLDRHPSKAKVWLGRAAADGIERFNEHYARAMDTVALALAAEPRP